MVTSGAHWTTPSHLKVPIPKSSIPFTSLTSAQSRKPHNTDFSLPSHVKTLTSTSNPFVKHCVKLARNSPYRHSHSSVLVVGSIPITEIHLFQESLPQRTSTMEYLFLLEDAQIPPGLENCPARLLRVSALVLKKLSQIQSTESLEAVALMKYPTSYVVLDDGNDGDFPNSIPSFHRILVLEGIQDPGNLGTLLRSAVAFKWGGVFLLPGCCDPFSLKSLRASRGAAFQLPIVSGSWKHLESLRKERKMKMIAGHPDLDLGTKSVSPLTQEFADCVSDSPLCLILGSEAHGLSENALQICDLVSIPMAGHYESLNVAVAGGIFLYVLQPKYL